jgi:hypothetical protein
VIAGAAVTLIDAVPDVTPLPVACTVVVPTPTPVIAAGTDNWPLGIVTGDAAVAMAPLAVVSPTVNPPDGAGAEIFTVMFWLVFCTTLNVVGVNVTLTCTFAVRVSGAKPGATAVICAVPMLTPFTCGLETGIVCPAAMNKLGVIVAIDVSLLAKLTVTPPAGAGAVRLIGKLTLCPRPIAGRAPRLINVLVTVTLVVPEVKPVALPVTVTGPPRATPVTVNVPVVLPTGIVTDEGATVAMAVFALDKVTAEPPAGAGCGSVIVPLIVRPTPTSGLPSVSMIALGATVITTVDGLLSTWPSLQINCS